MTTIDRGAPEFREYLELYQRAPLLELGRLADAERRRLHPGQTVTYIIDRNINYTNVCVADCQFCAFYRRPKDAGGYVLSYEQIGEKIEECKAIGGVQILLQGGLNPAIPPALKAPVPATNEGALGYAFDESTSPAVLSLIHVRAGALATSGDPRPWQNGEVTPIENVAKLFGRSPVDAAEWYFPKRLSLDVQAASPLRRNPAANYLHLRAWHRRGIDVPLYAIQSSLSRGRVLRGARRLVAGSRIPARRVKLVNASGVNSHLDPLTSAPDKSRFLKTVIPWLK